jgi:hypothetical protein
MGNIKKTQKSRLFVQQFEYIRCLIIRTILEINYNKFPVYRNKR